MADWPAHRHFADAFAASQAIAFEGQTFTTRALQIGEAFLIRCDGTAFKITGHTPPLMASRNPAVITITDRVTSDPGGPTPGARYIVQTGYGSYATGDIIEANNVSFNKYTPPTDCGWIAYVQDENRYYTFQDSAWVLGMDPAASSTVAGLTKVSTQALMETGTATDTAVLIGHQKNHPGHPKAGGNLNGSGTPAFASGDYGMGAVTDNGVGNYVVALDTAFADTNYWCAGYGRTNDTVGSTNTGVMSSGSDGAKSGKHVSGQGLCRRRRISWCQPRPDRDRYVVLGRLCLSASSSPVTTAMWLCAPHPLRRSAS